MAYAVAWDETLPNGSEAANTLDDIIREQIKVALTERFEDFLLIPDFSADPVRAGGMKFDDAANSIITLGDNAGTPRSLIIKNKAESATYYTLAHNSFAATLATVTTDVNGLSLTQTWNNAAVTFTGVKLNFTSTASGASSLLIDLQLAGTSQWKVSKAGAVTQTGSLTIAAGGAIVTGNSSITGTLTVSSTINSQTISASANLTGTLVIATGLTVSSGGATITGNSTVTGTLNVTSTLTVYPNAVAGVEEFVVKHDGGGTFMGMQSNHSLRIITNSAVAATISTAQAWAFAAGISATTINGSSTLTISSGGAAITGNSTITGTLNVTGVYIANGTNGVSGTITSLSTVTVVNGIITAIV